MYAFAANEKLVKYYEKELYAEYIGILHEYHIVWDAEGCNNLLKGILMKDYNSRLLASSEGVDLDKKIFFDIPKLCAYIREQKKKGRDSSDITLEEVKHLIIKNPNK